MSASASPPALLPQPSTSSLPALEDETAAAIEAIDEDAPTGGTYIPPSIIRHKTNLLEGVSYSHFSEVPPELREGADREKEECVLGVDEAGRGPVLGPMVYGVFYLPKTLETPLLSETHGFDDSKKLTASVRSDLMRSLCEQPQVSQLSTACGWATALLSARQISADMYAAHNLNNQAFDATCSLIQGVLDQGINVTEVYVDTVGRPEAYQRRLQAVFPTVTVRVEKKADSLFPCVSAASVCAKVSRDAALEVMAEYVGAALSVDPTNPVPAAWGSGYPSDARCTSWLRSSTDPVFGWGAECRFSWGTARELLEGKKSAVARVEWPDDKDDDGDMKMTSFWQARGDEKGDELAEWWGQRAGAEVF